jgi:hypothetical protein
MTTAIYILFIIVMALAGKSAWEHHAWVPAFVCWSVALGAIVMGIAALRFDPDTLLDD